jgi:hypothetical protein
VAQIYSQALDSLFVASYDSWGYGGGIPSLLHTGRSVSEVEVKLQPTVSRPVCLGVRRPSGTRDQFYFLLEIFFRQLQFCNFVLPSLTRGRVCNLLVQLLLGLARAATLGSKSSRTHGHILLSLMRLPQTLGPDPRDPVIPPGAGFHFCRLLRLAGTTVPNMHILFCSLVRT